MLTMKCNLNIEYAHRLRGVINENKYVFMYNPNTYCELCTILDRFEDTVEFLNNFELPASDEQYYATDFIMWVNFADLVMGCIKSLNVKFAEPNNVTFMRSDKVKFLGQIDKYFNNKNDDDYFRFIRAIVLAHSLKVDAKSSKLFTNNVTAYAPLVRWNNTHNQIEITYYVVENGSVKSERITLHIERVISYLEDRYSSLPEIFPYIEKENDKVKEQIKKQYVKDFAIPVNSLEKIEHIREVYKKNGDIDVKNDSSIILTRLKQLESCLSYDFDSINAQAVEVFGKIADCCLEDLIDCLKEQRDDFLLNDILCGNYNNRESCFCGCEYEVNKIVIDYCNHNQSIWYDFDFLFDKVRNSVGKYVVIKDEMGNAERAFLTMIAFAFNNILSSQEIFYRFPTLLIDELNEVFA